MKLFKRNTVYDSLQGKRIGVIGLSPRCGTTHIAVAISNYLSDERQKSVCLLERSGHDDLRSLAEALGKAMSGESAGIFSYHRVTYVGSGAEEPRNLINSSFDCTVFDFGSDIERSLSALCLCDYRIVVGSAAPWRRKEYEVLHNLSEQAGELTNWRLFVNLGSNAWLREYAMTEMEAFCFPFEEDPVFPGEQTVLILQSALN